MINYAGSKRKIRDWWGIIKRVNSLLKFNNIKTKIKTGSVISLKNTNISYTELYKLEINNITYLFFNECENVYIIFELYGNEKKMLDYKENVMVAVPYVFYINICWDVSRYIVKI